MTEQQYRVVADRDKGDDPKISDAQDGDVLAFRKGREFDHDYLVRIERPVPTTDDTEQWHREQEARLRRMRALDPHKPSPHLPTREQIADVVLANFHAPDRAHGSWWINPEATADAVLALIQNGADR